MEVLGAKKKKNKEIGIVEYARRKQIAKEKTAKKGDTLFTTYNSFPLQFSVRLSCALFFLYTIYMGSCSIFHGTGGSTHHFTRDVTQCLRETHIERRG
jgi:hypothetical protein